MTTDPKPTDMPAQQDISDAERQTLLRETLRSLQDAFSETNEDDAATVAQIAQNPAEEVTDVPERPQ